MSDTPGWRQVYDAAEHRVAPPLESFVHSDGLAAAARLGVRVHSELRSQAGGLAARVWHFANLPAGTDISRLRAQIGALDREVRRLNRRLEQQSAAAAVAPERGC
ncbi:MAG TPA: hypothetical protein VIW24_31190 [Aldersonia sp.]